jgi:hypothetical protein
MLVDKNLEGSVEKISEILKILEILTFEQVSQKGKNKNAKKHLPVITSLSHVTTTADEFWIGEAAKAIALGKW